MQQEQQQQTAAEAPPAMVDDRAALRASVLAEWAPGEAIASEPAPPAEHPDPDPSPEAPAETPGEEPTEPAVEEPPAAEPPPAEGPPAEVQQTAADPELAKRLKTLQAQEKRAKDQVAKERSEVEAKLKELNDKLDKVTRFEELQRRARFDPAGVMAELGLGDEDFEPAARALWSRSPAAAKDPRTREQAERILREREQHSTVSQLQKELGELRSQIQERDQRERNLQEQRRYLQSAEKVIGDEVPAVRAELSNDPDGARESLWNLASEIYQQTGEVPEPGEVVRELEKRREGALRRLGVDYAQVFKKQQNPVAGEKRNGQTKSLSNTLTTTTKPRQEPEGRDELRAEVLRGLSSGNFDD